ncbi:CAP-Gly domain protein [Ceratobasidium sp. AG-Ba]|nr:CAP-Gly domain protein [Ceratobasidium sp. AG-Ba]
MANSTAYLFDRNPLHVAHLQGPTERLPDANLRAVYERAGKILLIQRYKEVRVHGGECHAFLLFETEQAAQACCSRIGALRVTSDRQNSRPITASPLSCTNAASNHILNIWLRSQTLQPSYVTKDRPEPPPSASFPLNVLTPLNENYALVVEMLRQYKCAPSWWRFVAQMYVSNKMWTAAQHILGQSTKSEQIEVSLGSAGTAKGKEQAKDTDGSEDVIDISDDSIGEAVSEPDDESAQDFARMQKLQQKKAPSANVARKYGNAWLTHKPNMQNARAKLGIVTGKEKEKDKLGSSSADKSTSPAPAHESESEPEIEPPTEPAPAPEPMNAEPIPPPPAPTPAPAQTPVPLSQQPPDPDQPNSSSVSRQTPAPVTPRFSTPAPGHAISPPFVPTPMLGTPIPSTPKHKSSAPRSSSASILPVLPSTPKTQMLPRPPTLPPTPSMTAMITPSRTQGQGPTIASLVRPKTQSPGDAKGKVSGLGDGKSPDEKKTQSSAAGPGDGKGSEKVDGKAKTPASPSKVVLPALPAGMPQRPAWIPTSVNKSADVQDKAGDASTSAVQQDTTAPSTTTGPRQEGTDEDSSMSAAEEDTVEKDLSTSIENDTSVSDAPPSVNGDQREEDQPKEATGARPNDGDRPKEAANEPPLADASSPSNCATLPTAQSLTSPSRPQALHATPTPPKLPILSPAKSQTSPCSMQISPPTTQPSSPVRASASPTKRKSDPDTRGFEARLKRRRHRESPSKQPLEVEEPSGPSLASLTSGPSLASLSNGPSLTSFTSLGDSVFGASITPLRASEEPLTPKETIRARHTPSDRRTPLSDMDPRTWKATLDENEALKMKIRVLELTLPTAETVKHELYAERREKAELIEKLEIQRSLLVQSEALRKQSESTREELGERIKQLEDRVSDSAVALEQARESVDVAATQRRQAEEAARAADSERTKIAKLLDAERTLVQNEKAALAKEREARAAAETKLAMIEARLAAEQRRATETSEMAEKERAEAKNFLDAEKAIVSAQEAKLEKEREIRAEIEARLGEVEERLKEERARMEEERARSAEEKKEIEAQLEEEKKKAGSTLADEKKAAEVTLAKELKRAAALLDRERAQVKTEKTMLAQERENRSKLEEELNRVKELLAGSEKALVDAAAQETEKRQAAETELASVKTKLADSEKEIEMTQAELKTTESQLTSTENFLVDVKAELDKTRHSMKELQTINTNQQSVMFQTRARLTTVENQLIAAKNELASAQAQLSVSKTELTAAQEKADLIERGAQQRDQAHQALAFSCQRQLSAAHEQAAGADARARAADEKVKAAEQMQRRYQSDLQRVQGILEREQGALEREREVLSLERTTLAKERILRQELQKKLAAAEEQVTALERQSTESKHHDSSRQQLQTQRTLLHMAQMRIQELEQALQRVESDLDAARSAEATAKTMIQLGWGPHLEPVTRPRIRHTHSSPISDPETEFPSPREDPMDEDLESFNPFIPLMKAPRQQSFKLKRTALPSRLLRIDMPSGEPVNIDLGGLPPNPAPVIELLHKSQCAGVFWDIIMDEYGAMGGFEAAEAVASGKLRYIGSD